MTREQAMTLAAAAFRPGSPVANQIDMLVALGLLKLEEPVVAPTHSIPCDAAFNGAAVVKVDYMIAALRSLGYRVSKPVPKDDLLRCCWGGTCPKSWAT